MTGVFPYCGEAPIPLDWLSRWNFDPILLLAMTASAALWWFWPGRGDAKAMAGLLAACCFVFVSPFCAMGSALFLVRIVHDLILTLVIAPLAVAAFRLRDLPIKGSLAGWTAAHLIVFLGWHAPPLYAAAMSSDLAFWAMQVTVAGSAAIWWTRLLADRSLGAVLSLLAGMVGMGLLGALLTFADHAFYTTHWFTTHSWGLTPLEDQQLAGIVMWAPAAAIYLLIAMVTLYRGVLKERPA